MRTLHKLIPIAALLILSGCGPRGGSSPDTIVSMQTLDRNGFSETVSNPERLKTYQNVNFNQPQPYQKVLRVFGKDNAGKSFSTITSYHPNGQIWQLLEAVDGRANGLFQEWYENGLLKIESHVIEGVADLNEAAQKSWIFDDISTAWDESGNKAADFTYEKGVLHGRANYYHPNGQISRIIPYEKGILEGSLQAFDTEGSLIEDIHYLKGKKEGAAKGFWSTNTPRYQEQYREGLLLSAYYQAPDGETVAEIASGSGTRALFENERLAREISYRGGKPEGVIRIYRPDGTLQSSFNVKNEMKHGEEWEYYPSTDENPVAKLFINWHEDVIQGMVKTWYENGVLESQREMNDNKKHGLSFAYYNNGDLMLMEEYEKNKLVKGSYYKFGEKSPVSQIEEGTGVATLFTPEGHFLKKVNYEQGRAVAK
jgi:antitoxin component YwqK of YwqJK toxin-antitoxin module